MGNEYMGMRATTPTFPEMQPVHQKEDKLITKKMASERLSVSIRTLDRMIADGLLEKVFVGSSPRLRKSDIDRIITHGV